MDIQQGLQKTKMVTNTSDLLQELGKMNFFGKGEMVALEEQDTDCTHMVCSRLMLSGLCHLDERAQVEAKDYLYDPNTGNVQKSCPKCKFYLQHPHHEEDGLLPSLQMLLLL